MDYGGTLLDPDIKPNINIHNMLSNYFNNPLMTKLEVKHNQSHYYCKINCKLLNQYRYIIAITLDDNNPIGTKLYLQNINWNSFQTRTLKNNHNIKPISYRSDLLDDYHLKLLERDDSYTTYICNQLPNVNIYVINQSQPYPSQATFCNAIEQYQTLINLT